MVTTSAAVGIAVVALGLVLTPGPNMIYLVSRSITQGRRAGLISLLGVAVGFLVYLAVASAGLATVFVAVPAAYTALKLAGAAYLLCLAWQPVRPGGTNAFAPKPLPIDGPRRLFAMGLLTNLLNPKIAVLYVSVLPQFIDPERGSVALQSLVLGLTQITIALSVNTLIVVFAGALAAFLAARPTWLRVQRYLMGGVLGALAVRLATERTRTRTRTDLTRLQGVRAFVREVPGHDRVGGRGLSGSVRRARTVDDVAHGDECGGAQRLRPVAYDEDVDRGDREGGAGTKDVGAGNELVAAGLSEELDGVVHRGGRAAGR